MILNLPILCTTIEYSLVFRHANVLMNNLENMSISFFLLNNCLDNYIFKNHYYSWESGGNKE